MVRFAGLGDRSQRDRVPFGRRKAVPRQMKLVERYFSEIAQDTGKYCFGIKEIVHALENGAMENIVLVLKK